jgi:hypothetical protein
LNRREGEGAPPKPEQSEPGPDLLADVLSRARDWNAGHEPAKTREVLTDGVRPYLGDRATDRLVSGAAPDGHDLLSSVEPVLAIFLGRRAAGRLVTRVFNRALVRL